MPSTIVANACADREIVVRTIPAKGHGTYVAVANTGLSRKADVTINVGVQGRLFDSATGEEFGLTNGRLKLSMYPCELRALRVEAVD